MKTRKDGDFHGLKILFNIIMPFNTSTRKPENQAKDPLKRPSPAAILSLVMDSPASCPVHVGAISKDWRFCAGGCDRDVRILEGWKGNGGNVECHPPPTKIISVKGNVYKGYSTWIYVKEGCMGFGSDSSLRMVAIYDNVRLISNFGTHNRRGILQAIMSGYQLKILRGKGAYWKQRYPHPKTSDPCRWWGRIGQDNI